MKWGGEWAGEWAGVGRSEGEERSGLSPESGRRCVWDESRDRETVSHFLPGDLGKLEMSPTWVLLE